MDEDSRYGGMTKGMLGAAGLGGLGAVVAAFAFLPRLYALYVALAIVGLALLLFGGYWLWRRQRARRRRDQFTSALEAQTASTPKSISDPNQRAALDKLRQKFQTGLQEFKSRGKDIYKLPWYVIIGEPGSGKSEAIRHSGVDFPPGMQDELQGSGGTVNMDWWFTNRGIILDTAGSMLFNEARAGEAPEWREFLRLLKRARPLCPVNGLFLVLSVESLIKDSADTIAQKASRLAQQLDLIQRNLDVRFPVYLLVTKCDLLIGFREFFDSIEDPLLQHQIFGWSNPDPLDVPFRPDLIEQNLRNVAARLRRRRLALLRDTSTAGRLGGDTEQFFRSTYQLGRGPAGARRLDEVDSLFALPESVMRLAPRLRRYLETIFVAGEWSAKPVFLRGIYFTSSMREGKALDEAIALATGLPLDQLPEDRLWEKNKAYFLRDLFVEKVFRESGLVTHATNTLQLLRKRQLAIFGSAGAALLLLLVFSGFSYRSLKHNVLQEAEIWKAGATISTNWSPAVVTPGSPDVFRFTYSGTNPVSVVGKGQLSLIAYNQQLEETVRKKFRVGLVFQPMRWLGLGRIGDRREAQRLLFEGTVLKPLVSHTREKMEARLPSPQDPAAVARHREALLSLVRLEADELSRPSRKGLLDGTNALPRAEEYLRALGSYLTETTNAPDPTLASIFAWTFSEGGSGAGKWPPRSLLGGDHLTNNPAIQRGLDGLRKANQLAEISISNEVATLNSLVRALAEYQVAESNWLRGSADLCHRLADQLAPRKAAVDQSWMALLGPTNYTQSPPTNLASRYHSLEEEAAKTSTLAFSSVTSELPDEFKTRGIISEILDQMHRFESEAGKAVHSNYEARRQTIALVDGTCIAPANGNPCYAQRWSLYSNTCELVSLKLKPDDTDIGTRWQEYTQANRLADQCLKDLAAYKGPLARQASNLCATIASEAIGRLKNDYLRDYEKLVSEKLRQCANTPWTSVTVSNAANWLTLVKTDVNSGPANEVPQESLRAIQTTWAGSRKTILDSIGQHIRSVGGFPLVLDSTTTMTLDQVCKLRGLLQELNKQLQQPVWLGCDALDTLRATGDRYLAVAEALLADNGKSAAEWQLYFLPPTKPDDRSVINKFRYVRVTVGGQRSSLVQLDNVVAPLPLIPEGTVKGIMNSNLGIAFRQFYGGDAADTPGADAGEWGIVRFIKSGVRSPDGTSWQFGVRPQVNPTPAGAVFFEARFKRALPKLDDWPAAQ